MGVDGNRYLLCAKLLCTIKFESIAKKEFVHVVHH